MSIVSIVTPSYNSAEFIAETIESVLSQTYVDFEMIIIDDGSIDESVKIINTYIQKDKRIKLLQNEKNLGPGQSRNRGIKEAKGRYIAFLDADDLWIPEKLEHQLIFMEENNYAFTYSSYEIIDDKGQYISKFIPPLQVDYYNMLKTCSIGCLTVIYDTEYFGKKYMPNVPKGQDLCLWLDLLNNTEYAYGIMHPLTKYRIQKNSISRNKFKKSYFQWKIYREHEKLNIFKSIYYFVHYAYYGYLKNRKIFKLNDWNDPIV